MLTIAEYLDTLSQPQRDAFEHLRTIVKQMTPDAEESISYGMPTFKYKGKPLIYFGAFKNHMSLFPTPGPTENLKEKLRNYKVSKGTIQFTIDNPLSDSLIKEIILSRLSELNN